MKKFGFPGTIIVLIFLLSFTGGESLFAIPAFARKYQISCQVCHSPSAPRLKGFGDEFAGNGFRMTEYEAPRHFLQTGDDKLSLFRELPLAVRLEGFLTYNFSTGQGADLGAPYVVKILSGGELSEHLSYYFYFLLSERGEIAGLEDAFLTYNDLFGSGINISVGQFSVSDPLFKSELRLTLEPYMIYGVAPGTSCTNLKYDRGVIFDKGFSTGTTIVGEIITGNGIGEGEEGFMFDKDKYKNIMLRLSQDIGDKLTIGLFGYSGKEMIYDWTDDFTNNIKAYGADFSLDLGEKFIVNAQYLIRSDSEVYLEDLGTVEDDIFTRGGFVEIIVAPKGDMSKWYFAGLVNLVDSDIDEIDYTSATMHAGYLLRRNVRLATEYTHYFTGEKHGKLSFGFVSAF